MYAEHAVDSLRRLSVPCDLQRRLHDGAKVRLLIRTHWIRMISYWLLAALAISILVRVLRTGIGTA